MKPQTGKTTNMTKSGPRSEAIPPNIRDQLRMLADNDGSDEQIATSATICGILHNAKLGPAVIAICSRINELGQEAIDELRQALAERDRRQGQRRRTAQSPPQATQGGWARPREAGGRSGPTDGANAS